MAFNGELLTRVIYGENENQIRPRIVHNDEEGTTVEFGKLGLYKRKEWEHQREWRYRVLITPFSIHELKTQDVDRNALSLEVNRRYGRLSPTPYVHLDISEVAFGEMQLTTSPKMSAGNKILVDLLREKYNPSMQIHSSSLEGSLR